MTVHGETLLLFLAALQIKHLVADFFLQSSGSLAAKARYRSPEGVLHAFNHAWLGFLPLLWFTGGWKPALALAVLDGVVHFHVDWQKARLSHRHGWTADMSRFWHAFAIDQMVHQLTYLAIAALALRLLPES